MTEPASTAARIGPAAQRLVLITGMSGAGRASALKCFEDLGYDAVDNMPLSLLESLAAVGRDGGRSLAVGIDVRTRAFDADAVLAGIDRLAGSGACDVTLVFLDCADEVLRRRFTETRRPHPLAADRPLMDGIARERQMLERLRERADYVIDTSDLAPGDLRRAVGGQFALDPAPGMHVFVESFSYRGGVPRTADLVFDVRFLANPHYEPALRPLTGSDQAVADYIAADPQFPAFFDALTGLLAVLLPGYAREGKSYLTIAVGCTGGRHRSVFVAERLVRWLGGRDHKVDVTHRDVDKERGN